jgi:SAM-dependent methyltransferase
LSWYRRRILPRLIHLGMRSRRLAPLRAEVAGAALGRVLEVGIGSGLNLPFYHREVAEVIGLDPSPALLDLARPHTAWVHFPVRLLHGCGEAIPLERGAVDTVVMTWTLCSVADPVGTLGEIRRVLKPGGSLLFVEHGRAAEPAVQRWQDRLTPLWRRLGGNCHLNRRIDRLLRAGGLRCVELERGYPIAGPRPLTFHYRGRAVPD